MPDLSAGFDTPNPFGLMAADINYDMDAYVAALKFLSDLAGGTPEDKALAQNGGNPAMLKSWQGSEKFRRVLSKCRASGVTEAKARNEQPAAEPAPVGMRFIPLADAPAGAYVPSGPRADGAG